MTMYAQFAGQIVIGRLRSAVDAVLELDEMMVEAYVAALVSQRKMGDVTEALRSVRVVL